MVELGNMIFGNSRGSYQVSRALQDEFVSLMEAMGFDSYGNHDLTDDRNVFENETFWVMPYCWGDCTCGFDEREYQWCKENRHSEECYQSELKREKIAAGGIADYDPSGYASYISRPKAMDYDEWSKVERGIYDRLCAKHNLDPHFGCAVHCTCDHDKDYATWREANDHSEQCPIVLPNFWHKPSGFKLEWYKYPLRDSYSSAPLSAGLMRKMFADCAASMVNA